MGYSEWKDIEDRDNSSKDFDKETKFVKFKAGNTYKLRMVGRPYMYQQLFLKKDITGESHDIPVTSPGDGDPLKALGHKYSQKCAINVFNRTEDNELQVLRCGKSIFGVISMWAREAGENPGGPRGCEFSIAVEGEGFNRKYTVTALPQKKFTKDEMALVKDEANGGIYKLESICRPNTVDQLNEMIDKYGLDKPSNDADFNDGGSLDDDDNEDIPDF